MEFASIQNEFKNVADVLTNISHYDQCSESAMTMNLFSNNTLPKNKEIFSPWSGINSFRNSAPIWESHGFNVTPIKDKKRILKGGIHTEKVRSVSTCINAMNNMSVHDAEIGLVLTDSDFIIIDIDDPSKMDLVYSSVGMSSVSYETQRGRHDVYRRGPSIRSNKNRNLNGVDVLVSGMVSSIGRTITRKGKSYVTWHKDVAPNTTISEMLRDLVVDLEDVPTLESYHIARLRSALKKESYRTLTPPSGETIYEGIRNDSSFRHARGVAENFKNTEDLTNYMLTYSKNNMAVPLGYGEIKSLSKSAMRYHDRDGTYAKKQTSPINGLVLPYITDRLVEIAEGRKFKAVVRNGVELVNNILSGNDYNEDAWFPLTPTFFNQLSMSKGSIHSSTVRYYKRFLINAGLIQVVSSNKTGFKKPWCMVTHRAVQYEFTDEFKGVLKQSKKSIKRAKELDVPVPSHLRFNLSPTEEKSILFHRMNKLKRYLSCDSLISMVKPYMFRMANILPSSLGVDKWGHDLSERYSREGDVWKIFSLHPT